jgi:uncharacterized membrane protein
MIDQPGPDQAATPRSGPSNATMADAEEPASNPKADTGTYRVEGFSDAFFAIVITLLILDLQAPRLESEEPAPLMSGLIDIWGAGAAYVISFVNIYILWVAHHELMRITTRPDTQFLYLNGALLLGIGVMPFSTAVLAEHVAAPDASLAAGMYTGALLWVALFYNLIWRYLSTQPDRIVDTVRPRDRRRISRTYAITLGLYALAFAMAWSWPIAGVAITLGLALFSAVADRLSGFASEDVANEE